MMRVNSRRRVSLAAAGLTFSAAALMVGCGHARGERATAEADSAAAAEAATPVTDPNATASTTTPSTTAPATTPSNRESTDFEVSPVPTDRPAARVRARTERVDASPTSEADDSRATATVTTDDSRTTAEARVENPPSSTDMAPVTSSTPTTTTTTVTTTPAPTESAPTTSAPTTSAPTTSAPTTSAPTTTPSTTPAETTPVTTPAENAPASTTPNTTNREEAPVTAEVRTDDSRVSEPAARSPESPNASVTPSNAEAMPAAETANRSSLAGAAAVTACFANDDKAGLEYPSAHNDAAPAATTSVAPDSTRRDEAMAPAATAEVAAVPSDRPADAAMSDRPAEAAEPTGRIVPCMKSGEKSGRAAGAFLNDAQIAHIALIGSTIDSAVSVAASRRASNPAVREYAEMMIRDHTESNQKTSALLERLHMSPAQNEVSDEMLQNVSVLTAGMNTPAPTAGAALDDRAVPTARAEASTSASLTPGANVNLDASAARTTDRDTLHLNNRFVAAVNMQPWSSLLAGIGPDSSRPGTAMAARPATATASASVATPAAGTPAASASVTAPAPVTSDFDKKYIDYQVNFHQQMLDGLDARLIPWASPEIRTLLEAMRPKVAAHLERARELQRELNTSASN